jgi:ubiquinol-cytochrome c reductase cytochrome b subunit
MLVFTLLYLWPYLERRVTGDRAFHNVLDRPRDRPMRTAIGASLFAWIALVFVTGSADRVDVYFGLDYADQIWAYRVLVWVIPVLVFFVTLRVCRELQAGERVAAIRRHAEEETRAAAVRP